VLVVHCLVDRLEGHHASNAGIEHDGVDPPKAGAQLAGDAIRADDIARISLKDDNIRR
jgi:hypothetical protein